MLIWEQNKYKYGEKDSELPLSLKRVVYQTLNTALKDVYKYLFYINTNHSQFTLSTFYSEPTKGNSTGVFLLYSK